MCHVLLSHEEVIPRKAPPYVKDTDHFNVGEVEIFILTQEGATQRRNKAPKMPNLTRFPAANCKAALGSLKRVPLLV